MKNRYKLPIFLSMVTYIICMAAALVIYLIIFKLKYTDELLGHPTIDQTALSNRELRSIPPILSYAILSHFALDFIHYGQSLRTFNKKGSFLVP